MRSNSVYQRPSIFEPLGNGRYHYNYNIVESVRTEENGEELANYDYDTVEIIGTPTYSKVVSAVIREKYTADKEIALINTYNRWVLASSANRVAADKAEYVSYLADVDNIKTTVRADCIAFGIQIDD